MATTITAPKAPVSIGIVTIAGQQFDVAPHPEYVRFFFDFMRRVGGTSAMSNKELEAAQVDQLASTNGRPVLFSDGADDASWAMPGPAGPTGLPGAPGFMFYGEQGEDGAPGFCVGQTPPYRVALNATASRALNTTYTNVSTSILMVHLTVRCAVTLAGGNAYVQALMDTAAPPTVIATGLVGIQAGLLGEDNTFQLVFFVNPGGTYRVNSSATNGTVTLGNWFELPI